LRRGWFVTLNAAPGEDLAAAVVAKLLDDPSLAQVSIVGFTHSGLSTTDQRSAGQTHDRVESAAAVAAGMCSLVPSAERRASSVLAHRAARWSLHVLLFADA
jgi:hypothetical protein